MTAIFPLLRLLLGAIMVLTAANYFLPSLVPFISQAQWSDPMALRLIGAFQASGLLAVAKAIQLAGGALLLLNRAVPFALAAILCVHVCGAFIAVMVEGSVVLSILSLAVLALNGLLMLAYLPAFRGVLAQDVLADGEGWEDGENYHSLFVDPRGTAKMRHIAAALPVLLAAIAFYYWVVPFANGDTGLAVLVFPTLVMALHGLRLVRRKVPRAVNDSR